MVGWLVGENGRERREGRGEREERGERERGSKKSLSLSLGQSLLSFFRFFLFSSFVFFSFVFFNALRASPTHRSRGRLEGWIAASTRLKVSFFIDTEKVKKKKKKKKKKNAPVEISLTKKKRKPQTKNAAFAFFLSAQRGSNSMCIRRGVRRQR